VVLIAAAGGLLAHVLTGTGTRGAAGAQGRYVSPRFFGQHLMSKSRLTPALPVHAMRLWDSNTKWCQMAKGSASNHYDFGQLDALLAQATRLDADVEFTFGGTPRSAATGADPRSSTVGQCSGSSTTMAPADEAYWTNFVTAVVTHAKGRIRAYELWNEADSPAFWSGGVAALVRMTVDAAAIIHRIDPTALVLSPSVTASSEAYGFLRQYLSRLPPRTIDAVALHTYTFGARPENVVPRVMRAVRSALPPGYASTPIWSTEGGWGLNSQFSSAAADQRAFVARFDLLMLAQGVARSYWYAYQNSAWGTLWNGTNLTPAGIATRTLDDWLAGATLRGCTGNGNLWTCNLTTRAGQNARIVWAKTTPVHDYPTTGYSIEKTLDGGSSLTGGFPITVRPEPVLLSSD
jgi:hypothetical protein